MLNNKKFNVILSLIVAAILWMYVMAEVNPAATKSIKDISISYIHTDMLTERGLAMSAGSASTLDIEVTGSRSALSSVTAGDISATVDMAVAVKGDNEIAITVRVPSGITVTRKSISKISATVESLVSKEVDVSIMYTGKFKENQQGLTVAVSSPTVTLSGAESLVNIVSYARGSIDASRLSSDETDITCQLQAMTQDGSQVSGVTMSPDTVTVTSIISEAKDVKLTVPITDNSSDDAVRKTEYPQTVTIVGRSDVLAPVTAVTADPVDISNITENTEIALKFSSLPEGVSISTAKADSLILKLTVMNMSDRTFTFSAEDIKLIGGKDGFSYKFADDFSMTVTVRDTHDVINSLNKNDITISADVSALGEEGGNVTIQTKIAKDIQSVTTNPETAAVTVTKSVSGGGNLPPSGGNSSSSGGGSSTPNNGNSPAAG